MMKLNRWRAVHRPSYKHGSIPGQHSLGELLSFMQLCNILRCQRRCAKRRKRRWQPSKLQLNAAVGGQHPCDSNRIISTCKREGICYSLFLSMWVYICTRSELGRVNRLPQIKHRGFFCALDGNTELASPTIGCDAGATDLDKELRLSAESIVRMIS